MKEVNFDSGKNLLLRWAGVKNILPKEIFWFDLRSKSKANDKANIRIQPE